MESYLWMEVTADEYELPLAVDDSATELAKLIGLSDSSVRRNTK